jgi:hypothetical protein
MERRHDYCGIQWKDTVNEWAEERSRHCQFQDAPYFLGNAVGNQENISKYTVHPQDSNCVLPGYKADTQKLFQNSQQYLLLFITYLVTK